MTHPPPESSVFHDVADDELITPSEVASRLRVARKTVTRWAQAGKLGSVRTPGGHRRFSGAHLRAMEAGNAAEAPDHWHTRSAERRENHLVKPPGEYP